MVDVEMGVDDQVDIARGDAVLRERLVQVTPRESGPPPGPKARIDEDRLAGRAEEEAGDAHLEEPARVDDEVGKLPEKVFRVLRQKLVRVHEHRRIEDRLDLHVANTNPVHRATSGAAL